MQTVFKQEGINLQAGYVVTIQCAAGEIGTVKVKPPSGAEYSKPISAGTMTIGPFMTDCYVLLCADRGGVQFDVGSDNAEMDDVIQYAERGSIAAAKQSPGVVICDFQASSGALVKVSAISGETAALDSSTAINGVPALRCVVANGAQTVRFTPTYPVYLGSMDSINIPIRTTYNGRHGSGAIPVNLWIETATAKQIRIPLVVQGVSGEWQNVKVLRSAMTGYAGGADGTTLGLEAITKFYIVTTVADAGGDFADFPFWIGPITADTRASQGAVVLTADKMTQSQYDYLRPLLLRHGLRCSFANITKGQSGQMSLAQMGQLYADGNEIIHHTGNNSPLSAGWDDNTKYPTGGTAAALIAADIKITQDWLRSNGWTRGLGHTVLGFSGSFNSTVPLVRQNEIKQALSELGIKTVRSTVPTLTTGGTPTTWPLVGGDMVHPWSIGGGTFTGPTLTAADMQAVIDAAESRGELAVIAMHDLVLSAPTGNQHLLSTAETWLAYLAQRVRYGGVVNMLQSELYNEIVSRNS